MTIPRDSAWTYLRKYRHHHPTASLEAQEEATEAEGYVLPHRLTPPAPETQFRCYDPLARALEQGQTLALNQIRLLLPQVNLALHQDERFYDLSDGSWYLVSQSFVNERLIAYLSAIPNRETELLAFIENQGGTQAWTLWAEDPRLDLQGTTVRLHITSEEVETTLLHEAQAWLESQIQVIVAETIHPTHPTPFWQAALQLALQQSECFTQIQPGDWLREVPSAPSLEDLELITFSTGETCIFSPSFPDPPSNILRANARFTLEIGQAEVRLGYLPIPGAWQGAFNNRRYSLTWTVGDQLTQLIAWSEGGLLYGNDLHLQLLWAGSGGKLTVEKWSTGEIVITEHPWQGSLPGCFTLAELHQAQHSTLWQGLTDGVARAASQLQAHWQNMLDRDLTLAETQEALLSPHVGRNTAGFYWQSVDWPLLAPLMEPEVTSELFSVPESGDLWSELPAEVAVEAEPVLSDLFSDTPSATEPTVSEPVLSDLFSDAPLTTEPTVSEPALSDLFSDAPSATEPTVSEPVLSDLFSDTPSATEPTVSEPVLSDLFSDAPLTTEPTVSEPVLSDLFGDTPSATEPTVSEPVLSDLFSDAPLTTEPTVSEPVLSDLFGDTPSATEPTVSEPALSDLFSDTPSATEPTVSEPALSDLFSDPVWVTQSLTQTEPELELEDPAPQLSELFSDRDEQPELMANYGLADLLIRETAEPTVDPIPTIPSPWASLGEYLSALEQVTPPLTRRQSWAMLVQDLKPYLDFNEFTMIQRLWDGQVYTNLMVIRAKTMAFWCSQLPLALLPTQGTLEAFQEEVQSFYDCGDRDPQPVLVHLILPALGYQQVGQDWVWTNVT